MGQLNQATQQNASSSEELAATAEEMGGQAVRLQELMACFGWMVAPRARLAKACGEAIVLSPQRPWDNWA